MTEIYPALKLSFYFSYLRSQDNLFDFSKERFCQQCLRSREGSTRGGQFNLCSLISECPEIVAFVGESNEVEVWNGMCRNEPVSGVL